MNSAMVVAGTLKETEVFESVVGPIAVDVVDVFGGEQRPTDGMSHDQAVFQEMRPAALADHLASDIVISFHQNGEVAIRVWPALGAVVPVADAALIAERMTKGFQMFWRTAESTTSANGRLARLARSLGQSPVTPTARAFALGRSCLEWGVRVALQDVPAAVAEFIAALTPTAPSAKHHYGYRISYPAWLLQRYQGTGWSFIGQAKP